MNEKIAQLLEALQPLKKYKYMKNKKFNREISRLAIISNIIESANERRRKLFQINTGKNLDDFGEQLKNVAIGYKNSNNLVKAIKQLEKYIAKTPYTGDLLSQVNLSEQLWNVKKELMFAENNFFENYEKNVVGPIQYYATIEELEKHNVTNITSIPYNVNKQNKLDSRDYSISLILSYIAAFIAVVLMAASVGWVVFLAITWFYLSEDQITLPLIATGVFTVYMLFNGVFMGIVDEVEDKLSSFICNNYSGKSQRRTYRKITRSLTKLSEENLDIDFCKDAMKAYSILDDILENYLDITINYSRFELANAAIPRMRKLLNDDYFESAEEFKEAFIKFVENEIEYNNWRAEYNRKQREIEAEKARKEEEERKKRELEWEIKDAVRTIKETNETYKKIYDKVDEINENLNDIERDIRYR